MEAHPLDVGLLSNLVEGTLSVNGFGGLFSWSLGYIIIWFQVKGVQSYDEDQEVLVVPDLTDFGSWVLVTLGTPTISQIIHVVKESEIDELLASLNRSRISHLVVLLIDQVSVFIILNCLGGHWVECCLPEKIAVPDS